MEILYINVYNVKIDVNTGIRNFNYSRVARVKFSIYVCPRVNQHMLFGGAKFLESGIDRLRNSARSQIVVYKFAHLRSRWVVFCLEGNVEKRATRWPQDPPDGDDVKSSFPITSDLFRNREANRSLGSRPRNASTPDVELTIVPPASAAAAAALPIATRIAASACYLRELHSAVFGCGYIPRPDHHTTEKLGDFFCSLTLKNRGWFIPGKII